eukprot:266108_1
MSLFKLFVSCIPFLSVYFTHATIPCIQLENSASDDSCIPSVGLGTVWAILDQDPQTQYKIGFSSSTKWLSVGGRYFDDAHCYGSHKGIASGVLNYTENWTKIKRSEIFLVSKVGGCAGDNLGYNEVIDWTRNILATWNTTYIDLLLLHWSAMNFNPGYPQQSTDPSCAAYSNGTYGSRYNATICRWNSWRAMIELYIHGPVKAIGVSNFEQKHLNDLINYKYPPNGNIYIPSLNQMQFHGYWHEWNLLQFCKQYNIQYNSWASSGAPDVQANVWNTSETPVLTMHTIAVNIGKKYKKSAQQVWLRWQIQLNVIPIPRSNNTQHMVENMDVFDFNLSNGDMEQLNNITAPPYYSNLVYTPTTKQDANNLP